MPRFSFSLTGRKKQPVQPPAQLYTPTSKAHKILGSTPTSHDAPAVWHDVSSPITTRSGGAYVAAASYTDLGPRAGEVDDQHVLVAPGDDVWAEKPDMNPNYWRLDAATLPTSIETVPAASTAPSRKSRSSSSTLRSWYNKSKSPLSTSHQTSSSATAKAFTPPHTPLGLGPLNEGTEDTVDTVGLSKKEPSGPHMLPTMSPEQDAAAHGVQNDSSTTTLEMDRMLTLPSTVSPCLTLFPAPPRRHRQSGKRMVNENVQVSGYGAPHANSDVTLRPLSRNEIPRLLPTLYNHYEEMSMRQVIRQSSTPNLQATKDDGRLTLSQNVTQQLYQDEANHIPGCSSPATSKYRETVRTTLGSFPGRPSSSRSDRAAWSVCSRNTKASSNTQKSLQRKDLLENSVLMLSDDSEEDDGEHILEQHGMHGTNDCRSRGNCTSSASSEMAIVDIPSSQNRRCTDSASVASRPTSLSDDVAPTVASSGSSVISDQSSSLSAMSWQNESDCDIQEAGAITMIPAHQLSDLDREAKMKLSSAIHRAPSTDQPTPPLSPTSIDFYIRSAHSSIDGLASPPRMLILTQQEEMLISALRQKQQVRRQTSMSQTAEGNGHEKVTNATRENEGRAYNAVLSTDRPLPVSSEFVDPLQESYPAETDGHNSVGSQVFQASQEATVSDFSFPTPPSFRPNSHLVPERANHARKPVVASIQTLGFGYGAIVVPASPSGPPPTVRLPALPEVEERPPTRCRPSRKFVSAPGLQDVAVVYDDDDEPGLNLDDIRHWEAATSPDYAAKRLWQEGSKSAVLPLKTDLLTSLHPNSCSMWLNDDQKQDLGPLKTAIEEDIPRPDSPISPEYFPLTHTLTR